MNTGERIHRLRKENNMTQGSLADYLDVSRQSISKWESNIAYPETDKLIKIAELFNTSVDYLLRGTDKHESSKKLIPKYHYEYKSKKTLFGKPLIHINVGSGLYKANGIISIGMISKGILSLGIFSMGVFSIGVVSLGLIAFGSFALGLCAIGAIALGIIAIGAIAVGLFSIGALSIGFFSVGALSVGKYVAFGDNAYGGIALGSTYAEGSIYSSYSGTANNFVYDKNEVVKLINEHVPSYWWIFINWIKAIM